MAQIGTFTRDENGAYAGTIKTLTLNVKATIKPRDRDNDKAPTIASPPTASSRSRLEQDRSPTALRLRRSRRSRSSARSSHQEARCVCGLDSQEKT
ncbi:DUF736 family protein [Bradyrhizobium sp. 157]|uniref:DUF736 family protein n=1 Tax=Bradyrhizobium sp. 157 TaxID=2782631 RepID=UPI001FF7CD25|nr:DUF736 family protein [Bradyrhizobium sp. 157]